MESWKLLRSVCILSFLLGSCFVYQSLRVVNAQEDPKSAVTLQVVASNGAGRPIPETLFGIFFEISGPPEFLNNRTEADEEASARDAAFEK